MPGSAVFFLSDYGTTDEFVGVVHAVLQRLAPGVPVIDLAHQVPPFDVSAGGATLARSAPWLGAGVVLAVVDPGVGTSRRAVAVAVRGSGGPAWLVGPDNGLLVPAVDLLGGPEAVIGLAPPRLGAGAPGPLPGPTFDGRDVFAPAAAHLVVGGDPAVLGVPVDPATLVPAPGPAPVAAGSIDPDGVAEGRLATSVLAVDAFGNTQLRADRGSIDRLGVAVGGTAWVELAPGAGPASGHADGRGGTGGSAPVGSAPVRVRRVVAFADLSPGEPGLLVDSHGHLALVLNRASAAEWFGVGGAGRRVWLRAHP